MDRKRIVNLLSMMRGSNGKSGGKEAWCAEDTCIGELEEMEKKTADVIDSRKQITRQKRRNEEIE